MPFPEEYIWELNQKAKNHKDEDFRRDVIRIMHRRIDFEDESWERDLLGMVLQHYEYPSYSRDYEIFYERLLDGFKHGSLIVTIALAMFANTGEITEEEFWEKSQEAMVLDVEQFFEKTFSQMGDYIKKLKSNESERPWSFVKMKDYSGLKAYLKNSRKNPELYPLDKQGNKDYTMMHLAARMMDEKALKIMFDCKECDVLKDAVSDECLSPLALFLFRCDGKHQDIFRMMIRSGCDLLACNEHIEDCPLHIILKKADNGMSEYLSFLEDAIHILKQQGRLEDAFFKPISPSRRRTRSYSWDEDDSEHAESGDDLDNGLQFPHESAEEEEDDQDQQQEKEEEQEHDSQEQQHDEQEEEHNSVVESEVQSLHSEQDGMDLGEYSEAEDDELFGIRDFAFLRRMRSLYERRRESVLFRGMLRDRNIDAIQILLKHVPLPEDAKKTAIPNIVPSSDTWDVNVTSIKILLEMILKHGADIDGKDRRGRTALTKAVLAENVGLTSLLASKGASTSIVDDDGETPLSYALKIENKEIIDILNKQKLFARLASFPTRSRSPRPNDATAGHSESKCVICYDRPAEVIFAPCGHKVVCKRDCRKIFEMPEERRCCPLDKEKIESFVVKIYH